MTLLISVLAVSFNALSVSDVDDEGVPFVMSAAEGVAAYEAENEMEPGSLKTARIYFQMPNGKRGPAATDDVNLHHPEVIDPDTGEVTQEAYDEIVIHKGDKAPSWYNENNILGGKHYAGVYWWGGPADVDGKWVGYRMEIADEAQGIYYVDIPYDPDDSDVSVTTAIFNNGVDGGTDSSKPIYFQAAQTVDTNIEGAYPDDYDTTPYGSPDPLNFNGCIYIIDPDQVSINAFSQKQTCGANWYVYYGNGCYGVEFKKGIGEESDYPDGTPGWSDDVADICQNPDHFDANGNHVGYQPDQPDPTDPAPTQPAPTEAHVHTPGAPVQENVVPATCTAAGSYDEVVYCTECGAEISREHKTTEKAAHTMKRVNGKKATETAPGYKSHFKCTVCGSYFWDFAGTNPATWEEIEIPKLTPTEPPAPTQPAPTQPAPTQPAPTQPPTEPPISGFLGDVNGNGDIDIIDVTVTQRILASFITADRAMRARGDVDRNGNLESIDATILQRWLLGGPSDYDIGSKV